MPFAPQLGLHVTLHKAEVMLHDTAWVIGHQQMPARPLPAGGKPAQLITW